MIEPDTYFFSPQEALRVASQQNRSDDPDHEHLQICYYNGDKIESDLPNLIHTPVETLIDDLAQGEYRIPFNIDFTDFNAPQEIKDDITKNLELSFQQAFAYRRELNKIYIDRMKNAKLDFSEPLRFYIRSHSCTSVMQHIAKSIADTLKNRGHDVLFHLYSGMEDYGCHKKIFEYNPHVTININYLYNHYLGDDVLNYVWFQDPMPILVDDSKIELREKDFIFSLLSTFDELLQKKNVEFQRQGFCVNELMYKEDKSIKREKKIVFVGSSYINNASGDNNTAEAIKHIITLFNQGVSFTSDVIEKLSNEFKLSRSFLSTRLIPFVVRDISVLNLTKIKSDYEIEIYGWGWEAYDVLAPYYKGALKYGEDIAKVYNSATFAFAPHQDYMLQTRVLEASACGAIPIVYDCRDLSDEPTYEEAMYYFKTFDDLQKIISDNTTPQKDFTRLLKENSYDNFVDKILADIEKNKG